MNNTNKDICYMPFYMAEISENGNVYPCCPRFIDFYSFGNLFENNFQEIWFSEKANNFRNKILHNDYSLCNRNMCTSFSPRKREEVLYNWRKNSSTSLIISHLYHIERAKQDNISK